MEQEDEAEEEVAEPMEGDNDADSSSDGEELDPHDISILQLLLAGDGAPADDDDDEYVQSPEGAVEEEDSQPPPEQPVAEKEENARDKDDVIAHRTRARYRVEDIDWDALDEMLMEDWQAAGAAELDPELEEYLNFLSSLQKDQTQVAVEGTTGTEPKDKDEEENDPDYNESDGEGEARRASWQDYDELREDRAVRISQKELEALLAQAEAELMPGPKMPTPILPGVPALTSRARIEPLLTPTQYTELQAQFRQHGQLLAQVTALALSGSREQLSYAQSSLTLLRQLQSLRDNWMYIMKVGSPTSNSRTKSHFLNPHSYNGGVLTRRMARERADSEGFTLPEREEAKLAAKALFDVPALLLIPRLEAEAESTFVSGTPKRPPGITSINHAQEMLSHTASLGFSKELAITSASLRSMFTPAEDCLLAIGLERFGRRAFASVQEQYFPTKKVNQVRNRYKHLCLPTTGWNPVKALRAGWKFIDTTSLNPEEKKLVRDGIATYGYKWDLICRELLPHRTPESLPKLWWSEPADSNTVLSAGFLPMNLAPRLPVISTASTMLPVQELPATPVSLEQPASLPPVVQIPMTSQDNKESAISTPTQAEDSFRPATNSFDEEELSDSDEEGRNGKADPDDATVSVGLEQAQQPSIPGTHNLIQPEAQQAVNLNDRIEQLLPSEMFETSYLSDSDSDSDSFDSDGYSSPDEDGDVSDIEEPDKEQQQLMVPTGIIPTDIGQGKPWTREEDRMILESIRMQAIGNDGEAEMQPQISSRSPAEVAERRQYLLSLLQGTT